MSVSNHASIRLTKLNDAELRFVLSVLKLGEGWPRVRMSDREKRKLLKQLLDLESRAVRCLTSAGDAAIWDKGTWGTGAGITVSYGPQAAGMKRQERMFLIFEPRWRKAQDILRAAIVEGRTSQGLLCHLPPVGLPANELVACIRTPEDFVEVLVARLVATGERFRIVRCARCAKFAIRRRARRDSRYCSALCQRQDNLERLRKQYAESFVDLGRESADAVRMKQLQNRPKRSRRERLELLRLERRP